MVTSQPEVRGFTVYLLHRERHSTFLEQTIPTDKNTLCILKGNVKISQIPYKMIKGNSVPCRLRAFKINQTGIWQNLAK